MKTRRHVFKSVLVGLLAIVLLNFPFLSIPNRLALGFDIPVLYVYVFGVWLLLILSLFLIHDISIRRERKKRE